MPVSTASFVDPNNCALDAHGNLKDASDIQFYDSEQDETPLSSVKGMPRLAHLWRVRCYHLNNPSSNIDPTLRPADVINKSGAVPAEIIAGCQRIKPSWKAKRAAGINSSDEEESNGGL